jgi:NIPSNAP
MIYELRVYRCMPGRLPALLNRFQSATLRIWDKHGIRQAGFWTTVIGKSNNDLTYLLAWESLAEREQKWSAFLSDPEWIAARNDSEKDGPVTANVTSSILQPTSFSSVR